MLATVLIAFGAVLFGSVLSGIGYVLGRRLRKSDERIRAELRDQTAMVLLQAEVANLRAKVETDGKVLVARIDRDASDTAQWRDKMTSRLAALGEELAAVGALVQAHEEWHRDGRDTGRGVRQ